MKMSEQPLDSTPSNLLTIVRQIHCGRDTRGEDFQERKGVYPSQLEDFIVFIQIRDLMSEFYTVGQNFLCI